jgi:segregation and condensation protein B
MTMAATCDEYETAGVAEKRMRCVEALLMAADTPLSVAQLGRLLEGTDAPDKAEIHTALTALAARYAGSAVDLVEVAGGWRFQVGGNYGTLVSRLWEERPPKLSRALLETLAVICYRQPLARSDIESVRGVSVSTGIIRTLTDYDWIKVVGHREAPGRPALYATTPRFLDDFGVRHLADLPSLPEVRDADARDASLVRLCQESEQVPATQAGPPPRDIAERNDPPGFE